MKQTITLVCLFWASSLNLFAQVSISTADLPTVGTTKLVGITANPNIDLLEASATAQTWNFSNVISDNQQTISFSDTVGTPSPADYPAATLTRLGSLGDLLGVSLDALGLPIALDNATAYYSTGSDGHLYTNGINVPINVPGVVDLGNQSIPAEPFDLYLPALSYGSSIDVSGQYHKVLAITNPLPIIVTLDIATTRSVSADAFGTLQLFGQSYEVLRYKEILTAHLAADAGLLGAIDSTIVTETYRFMSPGQGYPVASVAAEQAEAGLVATRIEYIFTGNNPQVGVSLPSNAAANLVLSPNVVNNSLQFSYNSATSGATFCHIYSLNGAVLMQQPIALQLGNNSIDLSVANLPTGSYWLVLESGDKKIRQSAPFFVGR